MSSYPSFETQYNNLSSEQKNIFKKHEDLFPFNFNHLGEKPDIVVIFITSPYNLRRENVLS